LKRSKKELESSSLTNCNSED